MNCAEVEIVMIDYLDHKLKETIREEMEKHLETCERCMDELQDFQQIVSAMNDDQMEVPDETLRINFYHMLHTEMNKAGKTSKPIAEIHSVKTFHLLRWVAGVALFLAGSFLGLWIQPLVVHNNTRAEISQLHTEMKMMKEMVALNLLKEDSPSERIKAVNYAEGISRPDESVIAALVKTLNQDKNVNVRLAAAYSLAKFPDSPGLRKSLVQSLENQTEPIIQVVLINILAEKNETSAVHPIQKIISNKSTLKEVKEVAQKSMLKLL